MQIFGGSGVAHRMRQEVLGDEMDVVSTLRQRLASTLGRERFELWFGSQVSLELAGEAIVVSAADPFTLERVRRQFGRDIQRTATALSTVPIAVEFRVAPMTKQAAENAEPENPESPDRMTGSQVLVEQVASSGTGLSMSGPASKGLKLVVGNGANADGLPRRRFARFETYIAGASNRIALTAAESVAHRLGALSPLFLYGPTGSGKTHLLEAIWSASRSEQRRTRALLLSAEQFTTYFLEALQGTGLPSFRRKVRDVDLLVIDDIHFFAGKRATLVEFQHTLDALVRQGRQLVVSSDRTPMELTGLGPELIARLTGGLVCGLELADYETRVAITRDLIARERLTVPNEVAELIALETSGDARQIHGALNRLQAASKALQQPITFDLARSSLSDIFASAKRIVRLPDIERAVCEVFGLEPKCLRESGKTRAASQPRMLAMWLARKYTRMAFSEISEFFGRRSHTTVISAEQKVNRWMSDGTRLQLGHSSWSAGEAIRHLEMKLRTG